MKIRRERFPIRAGCLHADVHIDGVTILQPRRQLLEPLGVFGGDLGGRGCRRRLGWGWTGGGESPGDEGAGASLLRFALASATNS